MGQCVCGKPFPIWNEVWDRRKIQLEWEKKGVVKRIGPNRYERNPFLSQFGLRMRRAQWKNYSLLAVGNLVALGDMWMRR